MKSMRVMGIMGGMVMGVMGVMLIVGAGCKMFGSDPTPPSAFEARYYNIDTQVVARVQTEIKTNYVTHTNVETVTLYKTNEFNQPVPVYLTNLIPMTVPQYVTLTNIVPVTNYVWTSNTNAANAAQAAGSLTNMFAPGFGGLATGIAMGLFGMWGRLRGAKKAADGLSQTAGVLTQVIEVGQELMKTTQGAQAASLWKNWMVQHQAEQGVIEQVMTIIPQATDNEAAREVAAKLTAVMQATKAP